MANITVDGVTVTNLVLGTTGDDMVTFGAALAGANNANTGTDNAMLAAADNAAFATGALYSAATDTWTIGGGTLVGFESVTFENGETLEAGVASTGQVVVSTSGLTATITNAATYAFDGAALTVGADLVATYDIVSVEGNTDAVFLYGTDGQMSVASDAVTFTPNSAFYQGMDINSSTEFTVSVDYSDGTDTITTDLTFSVAGQETVGDDTFTADDLVANYTLTIDGGNDTLIGNDANNTFDASVSTAGMITIVGGLGDDNLTGGAGNDLIKGGAGVDTIDAGAGIDEVRGAAGDDVISNAEVVFSGAGNDNVTYTGTDNGTFGLGDGDDTLVGAGAAGDDVVYAGAGNDTIDAGAGNDLIFGGAGNDAMTGGAGDDTFKFNAGHGVDTIADFGATGSGDELDFTTLGLTYADIQTMMYETNAGVVIEYTAEDSVTLTGVTLADISAADFA